MTGFVSFLHCDLQHLFRIVRTNHIISCLCKQFCHVPGTAPQIQYQSIPDTIFSHKTGEIFTPFFVGNIIHEGIIYTCKACIRFHTLLFLSFDSPSMPISSTDRCPRTTPLRILTSRLFYSITQDFPLGKSYSDENFSLLEFSLLFTVPVTSNAFSFSDTKKNVPWHILAPSAVACDFLHLRASAHLRHVVPFIS